ncbi:MAG: GNAT family N-acetyltransferase [Myxococcota bacterium]
MDPDDHDLELLRWDSEHFGWPVGRIRVDDLAPDRLRAGLGAARRLGLRLVYCFRDEGHPLGDALLEEFHGSRLSTQVTFARSLPTAEPAAAPEGVRIERLSGTGSLAELAPIALEVGRHSRFNVDPSIPRPAFESLYRKWLENSLRGEIADAVFAARAGAGALVGFVSLTLRPPWPARIGLVGVGEPARRAGVATALVARALAAMGDAGAPRVEVSTQRENPEACRFYGARGFREVRTRIAYHFWPGRAGAGDARRKPPAEAEGRR